MSLKFLVLCNDIYKMFSGEKLPQAEQKTRKFW